MIMNTTDLNGKNTTSTPAILSLSMPSAKPIQNGIVITIGVTGSENSWIGWNAAGMTFNPPS